MINNFNLFFDQSFQIALIIKNSFQYRLYLIKLNLIIYRIGFLKNIIFSKE